MLNSQLALSSLIPRYAHQLERRDPTLPDGWSSVGCYTYAFLPFFQHYVQLSAHRLLVTRLVGGRCRRRNSRARPR